jgi:CRISPR/Cas system CSM-associated protein Csm5 (group 7 of RAMP superfamily)
VIGPVAVEKLNCRKNEKKQNRGKQHYNDLLHLLDIPVSDTLRFSVPGRDIAAVMMVQCCWTIIPGSKSERDGSFGG